MTKAPLPNPTPTPNDDPDVIQVDSSLVPVPVSVVDASGRAVTNLKLSDFELRIDGKVVEIGELARSESPIRLAMLFDNSSSVLIARDFEKEAAVKFFRRVVRPDRDMASLFSLSDYTRLEQPLTRDVSMLTRAIDQFPPPKGRNRPARRHYPGRTISQVRFRPASRRHRFRRRRHVQRYEDNA